MRVDGGGPLLLRGAPLRRLLRRKTSAIAENVYSDFPQANGWMPSR